MLDDSVMVTQYLKPRQMKNGKKLGVSANQLGVIMKAIQRIVSCIIYMQLKITED